MINLSSLFENQFHTHQISDENMKKFTADHLRRLSACNREGDFTRMITDTIIAYQHYYGQITDEDTKSAVQKGLNATLNNIVENFKNAVSWKEDLVRENFGNDSSEYHEFFPFGVTEYRAATLANIEVIMDRFSRAAIAHADVLGVQFQEEFQSYLTRCRAVREAQLLKMGEVAESKAGTDVKRDDLELELMKNVYLIAAKFVGNVNRCMDFFDQSFVREGVGGGDEEEPQRRGNFSLDRDT